MMMVVKCVLLVEVVLDVEVENAIEMVEWVVMTT
jgi:hypothetical protein